ncbi:MAG TPA: nuclear transport factor 2 family protein [Caulobacteraceae bacterium]
MTETEELRREISRLSRRVDTLEDINAIRRLHFAYGYFIDYCRYDEVVKLFSQDGEVLFLSGVYRGHNSISRLYNTWFKTFFLQGKEGPADGFLLDHFQMQDIVTVADDGQSAQGRFRTLLAGGNHESRAYKPEGLPDQFYEAGVYENSYVREDGVWKIKRLDYVVEWQAEYEKGWTHTISHLQPATRIFPDDPLGPDELLAEARPTWPNRKAIHYHYAHPVTGRALG